MVHETITNLKSHTETAISEGRVITNRIRRCQKELIAGLLDLAEYGKILDEFARLMAAGRSNTNSLQLKENLSQSTDCSSESSSLKTSTETSLSWSSETSRCSSTTTNESDENVPIVDLLKKNPIKNSRRYLDRSSRSNWIREKKKSRKVDGNKDKWIDYGKERKRNGKKFKKHSSKAMRNKNESASLEMKMDGDRKWANKNDVIDLTSE